MVSFSDLWIRRSDPARNYSAEIKNKIYLQVSYQIGEVFVAMSQTDVQVKQK